MFHETVLDEVRWTNCKPAGTDPNVTYFSYPKHSSWCPHVFHVLDEGGPGTPSTHHRSCDGPRSASFGLLSDRA